MSASSIPHHALDRKVAYTQQLDQWREMAGFEHRKDLHPYAELFILREDGQLISSNQVWRVFKHIPYTDTPRKYALYAILGVFYAVGIVQIKEIKQFLTCYEIPQPKNLSWVELWEYIEAGVRQCRAKLIQNPTSSKANLREENTISVDRHPARKPLQTNNLQPLTSQMLHRFRSLIILLAFIVLLCIIYVLYQQREIHEASAIHNPPIIVTLTPHATSVPHVVYMGIEPPPYWYPRDKIPHKFSFADGIGFDIGIENLKKMFDLSFPAMGGSSVGGDGRPHFWMFLPDPRQIKVPSVISLYQDPITMFVPLLDESGTSTGEYLIEENIYLDMPADDLLNE